MKESRFGQGFRLFGEGTGGDDEGVDMVANRVGDLINTDSLAKHCSDSEELLSSTRTTLLSNLS